MLLGLYKVNGIYREPLLKSIIICIFMKTFALWLTGIPSSGKSTIARELAERLINIGYKVAILESDELRKLLTPQPKYTEEERDYFYRAMVAMGKYLVDNGICVIFDATGHKRRYREYARKLIKNFMEIYVYAPLEICIKRDVKGLYTKALRGEIKTLPGLQVEYEEPKDPDLKIETHKLTVEQAVNKILNELSNRHGII